MELKEIRQRWEENAEVLLILTSPSQEVYTLLKGRLKGLQGQWHVFRYNRWGTTWQEHSVVAGHYSDMKHCLDRLNTEFAKFYPETA